RTFDTYLGVDYRYSSTLTFSAEVLNQHIFDWTPDMAGVARNRQTYMVSVEKLLMNDDLSISLQHFQYRPHASSLTTLMTSWTVNDNLTLSLNLSIPSTNDPQASLWNVRDQKQAMFKVLYQF